jgi:hypothetical protein
MNQTVNAFNMIVVHAGQKPNPIVFFKFHNAYRTFGASFSSGDIQIYGDLFQQSTNSCLPFLVHSLIETAFFIGWNN